jgi:hypothetical protein
MRKLALLFAVLFSTSSFSQSDGDFSAIKILHQKKAWNPAWNNYIANGIDQYSGVLLDTSKLPLAEIRLLCPDFESFDNRNKKIFWIIFIAALARYESNFDTACKFMEPAPLNYYSEGLLQLSYQDKKGYPNAPIDKSLQNITNAKVNLESGVLILGKSILREKTLFFAKKTYWSVLRKRREEISNFFYLNAMNNNLVKSADGTSFSGTILQKLYDMNGWTVYKNAVCDGGGNAQINPFVSGKLPKDVCEELGLREYEADGLFNKDAIRDYSFILKNLKNDSLTIYCFLSSGKTYTRLLVKKMLGKRIDRLSSLFTDTDGPIDLSSREKSALSTDPNRQFLVFKDGETDLLYYYFVANKLRGPIVRDVPGP